MKKIFLSLIAVAVGTLSSFAQDDLVATLSHGSTLSTFTGVDALSQAYTAAEEGDVITLSPGVFTAVTIEKAITVRGGGMSAMESNGYVSTQISGDLSIMVPSNTSSTLTIEGVQTLGYVYINGTNLAPIKCLKSRFEEGVYVFGVSMNAYSCIFANGLYSNNLDHVGQYQNTTVNCMNSAIVAAKSQGKVNNKVANIVATNSIVNFNQAYVEYCVFTNCILASDKNNNYPLPQTSSANNCIGINQNITYNLFTNIIDPTNVMIQGKGTEAFTSIFKTLRTFALYNAPSFTETFELTETAATIYFGDDGTQVGIYGGTNPFDPTPTNPQVKTFTVNSTTEGNQLKVKINVE